MVSVQFHDELASKAQVVVRCAGDAVGPVNRSRQPATAKAQSWRQSLGEKDADKPLRTEAHAIPRLRHPDLQHAAEFSPRKIWQRDQKTERSANGLGQPSDNGAVRNSCIVAEQQGGLPFLRISTRVTGPPSSRR